jgi:hypothetical protein
VYLVRGSRVGWVGVIPRFGTALPTTRSIAASDEIGVVGFCQQTKPAWDRVEAHPVSSGQR